MEKRFAPEDVEVPVGQPVTCFSHTTSSVERDLHEMLT